MDTTPLILKSRGKAYSLASSSSAERQGRSVTSRRFSEFFAALLVTALPLGLGSALAADLPSRPPPSGFSALYAFGDSLSDAGNVYIATGAAQPGAPYFPGEFSNGPNWVEDLSTKLGLGPDLPMLAGGNDWAFGGATTGSPATNNSSVPSGLQQIGMFLALRGGSAPSTALYTITLGGNDVLNIVASGAPATTAIAAAQTAALYEASEINVLANAGAKTFVVPLVADLGKTPGIIAQGSAAQAEASYLSLVYDATLQTALSPLAASLNGGLHVLNTFGWLDSAVANPALYGLTDVTDPCYVGPYTGGGAVCSSPGTYLFWDNVHPTATVDAILAGAAAAMLAPASSPTLNAAMLADPAPSPTPGAGLLSLWALILTGLMRKAPEVLARLSGV